MHKKIQYVCWYTFFPCLTNHHQILYEILSLLLFQEYDVKYTVMCISHLDKLKAPLIISESSRKGAI